MRIVVRGQTRREILEYVGQNPGTFQKRIQVDLGIAWGTILYHMQALSEQGLLRTKRDGRHLRVFPLGLDETQDDWNAMRHDDVAAQILRLLSSEGAPMRGIAVAQALGERPKVVRRRLAALVERGLLHRRGLRTAYYALAPRPSWQPLMLPVEQGVRVIE